MKSSRIAIRMTEDLRQKVQKKADELNVDMSTYVRMIISQHFIQEAKKETSEQKSKKGRSTHGM